MARGNIPQADQILYGQTPPRALSEQLRVQERLRKLRPWWPDSGLDLDKLDLFQCFDDQIGFSGAGDEWAALVPVLPKRWMRTRREPDDFSPSSRIIQEIRDATFQAKRKANADTRAAGPLMIKISEEVALQAGEEASDNTLWILRSENEVVVDHIGVNKHALIAVDSLVGGDGEWR